MRLQVTQGTGGSSVGYYYAIRPEIKGLASSSRRLELLNRLYEMQEYIEKVAKRELGKRFIELRKAGPGDLQKNALLLYVRYGTSQAGSAGIKLRDLLGWIRLFDSQDDK